LWGYPLDRCQLAPMCCAGIQQAATPRISLWLTMWRSMLAIAKKGHER
jgi:hypothetical protein